MSFHFSIVVRIMDLEVLKWRCETLDGMYASRPVGLPPCCSRLAAVLQCPCASCIRVMTCWKKGLEWPVLNMVDLVGIAQHGLSSRNGS